MLRLAAAHGSCATRGPIPACSADHLPAATEEGSWQVHHFSDEPELLRAHPGADLRVTASDEERVKGAVRLVELRRVSKVVDDYKHLVQFLHFQLLGRFRDLALLLDDAPQGGLIPLVPVSLLTLRVYSQVLLDVLLDGDPAIIDVDAWAEDVDPCFARLAGPKEDACAWRQGHHGVRGLLAGVLRRGEKLDQSLNANVKALQEAVGSIHAKTTEQERQTSQLRQDLQDTKTSFETTLQKALADQTKGLMASFQTMLQTGKRPTSSGKRPIPLDEDDTMEG